MLLLLLVADALCAQLPADRTRTPVLVDDIISTARTVSDALRHLKQDGWTAPVCVGVHAVFADDALTHLRNAGAIRIATCNTITHASNAIDVTSFLVEGVRTMLATGQ